jgi:hypothetical protein
MSSMQANKKRRLPKVLSILFGSSLVSLAMAMSSGPANAYYTVCAGQNASFDACFRCYYTNVGNQCCTSGEGAEGHGWCQAWSGTCC